MGAKAKELRAKDAAELEKILAEERRGLQNLKLRSAASELENAALVRKTRRQIARILTILNERARATT